MKITAGTEILKSNFGLVLKSLCLIVLIIASVKMFFPKISIGDNNTEHFTDQFICRHGYTVEKHHITTSDGYILNVHRIPKGKTNHTNGKVVLLVPGLFTTSLLWLLPGKRSIPFTLADQGFDVWLFDDRGSKYCRNHTKLNSETDDQFWNFSWHEIAIYDLPAVIDYIMLQTRNENVYYIGYSCGTTLMYVLLSNSPNYNDKIKVYIHIAPVAFLDNAKSVLFNLLAATLTLLENIIDTTRGAPMLTNNTVSYQLWSSFCSFDWLLIPTYHDLLGYSSEEVNPALIRLIALHGFSGGSTKALTHYLQIFNSGQFRQFDYGTQENHMRYGIDSPPNYNLSKVTAPGYLFYGNADNIVNHLLDLPRLYNAFGNPPKKFFFPKQEFNHVDFLFGKSADEVTSRIVNVLRQH